MAIFRFVRTDGQKVDFPYDFGQNHQLTLAVMQYWELEKEEIIDAGILPGYPEEPVQNALNKSIFERAYPRDLVLDALFEADYKKQDAARALGISPRRMSYILTKYNLREEIQRMREGRVAVKKSRKSYPIAPENDSTFNLL